MKHWKWLIVWTVTLGGMACAPVSDSDNNSQERVDIQNFTIQAVENDQVALAWDPLKEATVYKILRKLETTETFYVINAITENAYSEPLTAENYVYKIWALNDGDQIIGESEEVMLLSTTPAAPAIFKATPLTTTSIHLDWLPAEGASGYKLYRNDGYGYFTLVQDIKGYSNHNWTDIDLKTGYTYQYKITSVGAFDRESTDSKILSIATYSGSDCIVCDFKVVVECTDATCNLQE